MRSITLTAAAALLCTLAACGSDDEQPAAAAPEPAKPGTTISKADADALRAEIYPFWNAPTEPPCHQQLKIRIDLAADGRVIRADAKPELPFDDPCRGAQDAAIRAIWAASPLNVSHQRDWSSLTLIFDLDALL